MELTILDSILHGALRPWLLDTSDKKKFNSAVKAAAAASPGTYAELQEQLKKLLADFPALQKVVSEKPPTAKAVLQQPFFEEHLVKYYDTAHQFYFLLITGESLRVSNLLAQQVSELSETLDKSFIVKQILKSIRVLATQAANELRERDFTSIPRPNTSDTDFALFTLKQALIALFFEVQEQHKNVLPSIESEESFYLNNLGESFSGVAPLKPSAAFFKFQIQNILSQVTFAPEEAISLLKQIQERKDAKLQSLQTAIENLVFFHSQPAGIANLTLAQLADPASSAQQLSFAKKSVEQEINQHTYGHKRLAVVQSAIDKLDYIQTNGSDKNSIPASLSKWLFQQQLVYQQNASGVFASDEPGEEVLAKKKKPLPKQDKATSNEQKSLATEHLKFMSGANVHQEKIMQDADFNRLMEYTLALVETGKLPKTIKPIPQINLPTQYIRYTYYTIHKALYGTKEIKREWIDFLHKVFKQFANTEWQTIKTKFSVKPAKYDSDMQSLKR